MGVVDLLATEVGVRRDGQRGSRRLRFQVLADGHRWIVGGGDVGTHLVLAAAAGKVLQQGYGCGGRVSWNLADIRSVRLHNREMDHLILIVNDTLSHEMKYYS